jgi:hypothetical protein
VYSGEWRDARDHHLPSALGKGSLSPGSLRCRGDHTPRGLSFWLMTALGPRRWPYSLPDSASEASHAFQISRGD